MKTSKSHQFELMSYWVVRAYDPSIDMFSEVYKSYGKNEANNKLREFLANGICAIVEHRNLPMA